MNTLRKIYYLWKAKYGSFTDEAFVALCKEFDNAQNPADIKSILRVFLANQTLRHRQLNALYEGSFALRSFYRENRGTKIPLTTQEQSYLATVMEFEYEDHFPQALGAQFIPKLFEKWDAARIAAYVQDFPLPEEYELELIKRYGFCCTHRQDSGERVDYIFAMRRYVFDCPHLVLQTEKAQKALLENGEEAIWKLLCSKLKLTENHLLPSVVFELITRKYTDALREMLFKSYVSTPQLQRHLVANIPSLRWQLEISKLRHAMRVKEISDNASWNAEKPTADELVVIESWEHGLTDDNFDFARDYAFPRLKSGKASPYLCAMIARIWPEHAEEAYNWLCRSAEFRTPLT